MHGIGVQASAQVALFSTNLRSPELLPASTLTVAKHQCNDRKLTIFSV